jgi:hypothetical protein
VGVKERPGGIYTFYRGAAVTYTVNVSAGVGLGGRYGAGLSFSKSVVTNQINFGDYPNPAAWFLGSVWFDRNISFTAKTVITAFVWDKERRSNRAPYQQQGIVFRSQRGSR